MTQVTFTVDSSQLPQGPQGPAGKDGISPTIDMAALAAAVAAILGSPVVPPPPPPVTPPSGSNELQVSGTKILNPDGTEFRIRGVDICHYDSSWTQGVPNSGANAVRIFMPDDASKMASIIKTTQAMKVVPIACMSNFPSGTGTSGDNSTVDLASGVAWWVASAPSLSTLHPLIVNLANEWLSSSNPSLWQTNYISAIAKVRAAGYTQPILIDSDGYGQDYTDLYNNAAAVLASDPLKNVLFGYHLYGGTPDAGTMAANFAKLKATGLCVVVAEFGPGRNIGPSPTSITPAQVEQACEANGLGWLAWAWDDNNLGGSAGNDSWFSMTTGGSVGGAYHGSGYYDGSTASQLTTFGQTMVPLLKSLAIKSTLFK